MNRPSHCATCAEAEINNMIISLPDVVFVPPAFTFDDMLKVAGEAWGQLGINTVWKWKVYNEQYFGGVLRPIPLIITQTMPFGGRIGLCSHGAGSRSITINIPSEHNFLVGDNDTLLHEMVHQCLNERGENPKHASAGWRREIMRLHQAITGSEIWAGRSKTVRMKGEIVQIGGETVRLKGKVMRINEPHPDGRASLTQDEIARWPHSVNIKLGSLGQ